MRNEFADLKISEVMTPSPRAIEPHQSLETARMWMDELRIRHLPVRENGEIVGVLSDRDLGLMLGPSPKVKLATVEDAMISTVRTVDADRIVRDVAREMLDHRVGSVIVTERGGKMIGIFTDTDALRMLAD